jgi:hypothetical protein
MKVRFVRALFARILFVLYQGTGPCCVATIVWVPFVRFPFVLVPSLCGFFYAGFSTVGSVYEVPVWVVLFAWVLYVRASVPATSVSVGLLVSRLCQLRQCGPCLCGFCW